MKKIIFLVSMIIAIIVMETVCAEGILPSLSETTGVAMPSFAEALSCYPDSEIENEDGSITELYSDVSETDFNTFSVYLEQQGAQLSDYNVDGKVLKAEIQVNDAKIILNYDTARGAVIIVYPAGTYNEQVRSAKTHLAAAQKLLDAGNPEEAWAEILAIPQYDYFTPANELLQSNEKLKAVALEAKIAPFQTIGNNVFFGHFEQDNNTENGLEAAEWIVLDVQEGKCLLLSKYGLDARPYNTENLGVTWDKCSLRNWLNTYFLDTSFTQEEQNSILITKVDNSKSQGYSLYIDKDGKNTSDKIFLLSFEEAKRYLGFIPDKKMKEMRSSPTKYAINQGAKLTNDKTDEGVESASWWLRTPGSSQFVECVDNDGGHVMRRVDQDYVCIRPAFWLNLNSGFF